MDRFAKRFVLERELGAGGMARVFLGRDEILDRLVAVKILKSEFGDTDVGIRFRREGRTAARLTHSNIVRVYDAGEDEFEGYETSYIVMEYVSGGDLKDLTDERGPMSARELTKLGEEAAAGLAHAHERGVIHRDVKPHNILLDEHGYPKLTDFGIARALDATTSNHTRTGAYLGTALYSSPEQLQGEIVTPKSDVYSLGTTLYQAATCKPPFSGSPISVANQHVSKPPPSPREENADVGGELETLILACLAKDPDERPTAEELRSRLSNLKGDTGDTPVYAAAPVKPPTRPASDETTYVAPSGVAYRRRRRFLRATLATLALLAVLALVAAIVVPALRDGGQETQPAQRDNGQGGQLAQRQDDAGPNNSSGGGNSGEGDSGGGDSGGGDANADARPSPATSSASQTATSTSEPATGTAQSTSDAAAEPSQPAGLTEDAAAQTVEEVYTSAAADDYEASYALLSQNFRESTAGSQANWAGTFSTVQDISFVEGPTTATVSGSTATVEGVTIARHTDRTERNTGTWTLVNEGGRWKLDDIVSLQTEEI